jgi:hypothetical protein
MAGGLVRKSCWVGEREGGKRERDKKKSGVRMRGRERASVRGSVKGQMERGGE